MRRDEILAALTALGTELAERGLVADWHVPTKMLRCRDYAAKWPAPRRSLS
jgi:hypothetical protein